MSRSHSMQSVLDFIRQNPGADAYKIAKWFNMDLKQASGKLSQLVKQKKVLVTRAGPYSQGRVYRAV